MKKIKVLSLFDGISVAQQALKELGYDVEYYASEIDKYAIQITQKNHPQTIQIGNVQNLGNPYVVNAYNEYGIKDCDLLVGGSPCQDLSIAKKNRQGLDGARSGLFWEYVRILKEVRPKYFVLENVNSMPKEAKAIITEALGVEPIMINASLVSAQNRKRLFWVGKLVRTYTKEPLQNGSVAWTEKYEQLNITQPEDRGILLKDILEKDVDEKYSVKGVAVLLQGKQTGVDLDKSYPLMARDYTGFGNQAMTGVKKELNFLGGIRNKDWAKDGKNYSRNFGQGDRVYSPNGKSTTLSALGGGRGAKTGLYAIPVALRNRGKGKQPEYNGTDKANSMTTVQTDSMVQENSIIRKLTPIECERLQSLPDNYTEGVSNTQRYKVLGNAFNKEVVKHILSFMK